MTGHNRALWYRQPAQRWNEALPVGNGRLGAMVFGGTTTDRLQLNEDSLWYGPQRSRLNPDARVHLPRVQQLLRDGKIPEAEALAMEALVGVPENPAHYVPVGDFIGEWTLGEVSGYQRKLDLGEALATTAFSADGGRVTRDVFASEPDQVVVLRVRAEGNARLNGRLRFTRGRYVGTQSHPDDGTLRLDGPGGPEVGFTAMARIHATDGRVRALGQWLVVENASEVVVLIAVATSYRHGHPAAEAERVLAAARRFDVDELLRRHTADYRSLADRMDLDLHSPDAGWPTDERLARVGKGEADPGLAELYFRYGRYLLISSSRPGTLPATLQGIWNDGFLPPWGSKYTININTQMNYWPAEATNLGECHEPLLEQLERMLPSGREMAREMYGCRGFVAHHNTDLWGDCAPVDHWVPASVWPMGAAWLSLHLWQHWEYSHDRTFLARAFPILKEAATFFLDFLTEDTQGRLVTNPSVSPENTYILPSGTHGSLCFGPSMDSQILFALFTAVEGASAVFGTDTDLAAQVAAARSRLPQPSIGRLGQLMEWPFDYDEAEPGHRHISHLFALHPGEQITRDDVALHRACRVTLERRLALGGGHTGWSKAWIVNLWARLGDGDEAWENLQGLLRESTAPNLFDLHPPGVFQIDGNFGATAGLVELFVQSLGDTIHVLPALPRAVPQGQLRGIRAKGGFELDLAWSGGALTFLKVTSHHGGLCRLELPEPLGRDPSRTRVDLATQAGQSYPVLLVLE